MKKLFLLFIILVPFLFAGTIFTSGAKANNATSLTITEDPGEWVEYVLINGQWYKITHYTDGRPIDITAVGRPPVD